jgi:FKBP-type peptidyl-prolyl cis-trans isomerase
MAFQDACRPVRVDCLIRRPAALVFGGCLVNRFLSAVVVFSMVGCGSGTEEPTPPTSGPTTLQIEDITVGTGDTARNGDALTVHYVGAFLDGRVFDSSLTRGQPYTFRLGAGQVIAGWDQGILGMRVGGKRRLTIPSSLAYGASGRPPIPPNTPLQFEVDLLALTR